MEKLDPTATAESRKQIQELGFNYDKFNELLTEGLAPAELAEHLMQMHFSITHLLTHPIVMDSIGISYDWCTWLYDLECVINSLLYMNRYNLQATEEAV